MWTKPLFVDNALYIIDHPKSSEMDELMKDGDGLGIVEKIRIKGPLLKEQQEIIQKESKNGTITRAKAINSLFKELRTTRRTSGEHNDSFMVSQREDRGDVGLDENTFRGETNERAGYKRNDDNSETVPDGGVTDDISFQVGKDVEETKDLIAVHNIRQSKLNDMLELGGMPMPSIAITKADMGHNQFGDISFVMRKETIDPQQNSKNTIFDRDAWTPSAPHVDYEMNKKAVEKVVEMLKEKAGASEMERSDLSDAYNFGEFVNNRGMDALKMSKEFHSAYENTKTDDSYDTWFDKVTDGIVDKKGIYKPNAEPYYEDGTRKTFNQLHYPLTVDNIIKVMLKNGERGGQGFNSSFLGAAAKKYNSIDEVKASENRLGTEDKARASEFEQELSDIAENLDGDWFETHQDMVDAISKSHTANGIYKYLNKLYPQTMTMDMAKDIEEVVKQIQELPTDYFEAKPKRRVNFSEVALAVVPDNMDNRLIEKMRANGITNIKEYKAGDEDSRKQVLNDNSDDLRFQVIGEKGAKALDKAQEATTRLDNLSVARDMEKELSKSFAEKKELIEKLRNAKTIDDKYQGQYELNRESVKNWAKNNLRGEYKNEDTNETFLLNRIGENKVTSHSMGSDAHLKSIAAIPEMLRDAIFIEEMPNTKNNDKFDSYRYYVCGIKIDNVDYTAKITIGVKQGKKYYDHSLTDIQKGKLLDLLQDQAVKQSNFTTMGNASVPSYERLSKDNKLISILQTSDKEIAKRIKFATGWERGADGKWRYEIQDFDVKLDGSADKIRQEKKQSWYKELNELEDKIFDEKATDEEEKRFDELSELKDEWEKSRVDTDRKFLPDYIVDDELLNAYPQLKRVEVVTINNPKAPYDGMFDKDRNTIFVNEAKTNTPLRETLAHEVQHAIQHEEGFAQGGNENTFRQRLIEKHGFSDDYSVDTYRKLAGEVESRNVERRIDMTPEERRKQLLKETEDVAREDQIFINDSINEHNKSLQDDDIRFSIGDKDSFVERQKKAEENKGTVMPNLADKEVEVVKGVKEHGFTNFSEAKEWAKENIVRTYNNDETGGKGSITISNNALNKAIDILKEKEESNTK